jgi:hypothetical protein
MITTREYFNTHMYRFTGGAHGYDPRERDMHGIFLGFGSSFRERTTPYGPLNNVEVFNILGCALGINIQSLNNGTWPCAEGILTDRVMRNARNRNYPGA